MTLQFGLCIYVYMSRDSSVIMAAGYRLDGMVLIPRKGKKFSGSPQRPDRLWCPPSDGYGGLFPWG
jgi:hypothetical protein